MLDGLTGAERADEISDVGVDIFCELKEFGAICKFEVLVVREIKFKFEERGES